MVTTYFDHEGSLTPEDGNCDAALWIDMLSPTQEEEKRIEADLNIEIPTREEMREVESSSALYREQGATYVTIRVVERTREDKQPRLTSITLIVTGHRLVTLRYSDPRSFQQFVARTQKSGNVFHSSLSAMLCFLETVVDRDADILEEIGDTLDPISLKIFNENSALDKIGSADLGGVLKQIGKAGELASRVRESLHTVGRSVPFLKIQFDSDPELRGRLKTLESDVKSLLEHDNFLQTQIQFLLDSSIGLISIQQNSIMKTFSIAAVVFLPPTLIGSIYGMNFEHMPELHWRFGYLWALCLIVASGVGPLIYFRAKRWL